MRAFGIVPAAGTSTRMGQPKLLLPWGDSTVIEQVLSAWRASRVEAVLLVIAPGRTDLSQLGTRCGAIVIEAPQPPPDMKASVRLGLAALQERFAPQADDAWLLAPADMPLLTSALIDRVIQARQPERIVIPRCGGRSGHPVLFPWPYAARVFDLPDEFGIDSIVKQSAEPIWVDVEDAGTCADIDTPDDYQRLHQQTERDPRA